MSTRDSIMALDHLEAGHVDDLEGWFPSAEALVERCVSTLGAMESAPADLRAAVELMGAPTWELMASPYTSRVSALAATAGISFVHHERRHSLQRAEETLGEVRGVAAFERETGWEDGVFITPKYGAFTLEERLASRDPNLRPKWRPHELLHRLVGFYWHPEMTRFEAYVGARLGELLPVVHWYGFDEIFRGRCAAHARAQRYRVHCPTCEDAARAVATRGAVADSTTRAAALWFASFGRAHLVEEVGAVVEELRTGRRVETLRPRLNASSDAVGYVRAHWNRVTSWGMGAWAELFLCPEEDYATSVESLAAQVARVAAQVVGGACVVDRRAGAWRARRRRLQDLGMRALIAVERVGGDTEEAAMPVLERLGPRVRSMRGPLAAAEEEQNHNDLQALFEILERGSEVDGSFGLGARVWCTGHAEVASGASTAGTSTRSWLASHVREGLASGLPDLAEDLPAEDFDELVLGFIADPAFEEEASLRARFCGWLRRTTHPWAPRASLEHLVRRRPHRDEEAELFGAVPALEDLGVGELRLNHTARSGTFAAADVTAVLGWERLEREAEVEVLVAWFDGSARAVAAGADVQELLAAIREGRGSSACDPAQIVALVERGILVWLPHVDGGERV